MSEKGSKRSWEKDRRDRLKEAFTNLEKLLPSYDPSTTATKLVVLTKSIEYIQEMQDKIQELLKPTTKVNPDVLQLRKLQDRIKKLVSRIELLSGLLKEAKISIPKQGSSLKKFKYGYKWSGKISEKTAASIKKKTEQTEKNEKENKMTEGCSDQKAAPRKRIRNRFKSSSSTPKHRKNITNRSLKDKLETPTSNCFIIYSQASSTQSCYLVTNAPSNSPHTPQTVITNSLVASNPLMCTNIKANKKSVIKAAPALPTTLLLANGTLYVPQTQPILPTPMVLQVANNPMVIKSRPIENLKIISEVGAKSKMASTSNTKIDAGATSTTTDSSLNKEDSAKTRVCSVKSPVKRPPRIVPIRPNICPTKTTDVNNVPIPAVSSNSSSLTKQPTKNKRIDDKPLTRKAFRRIRKISAKKAEQEKEKEALKKLKAQENEEKQQNCTDTAKDLKKIPEKNIDNLMEQPNISIISNEIISSENNENAALEMAQIDMNDGKQDMENSQKQIINENKIDTTMINCGFPNETIQNSQIENANFLDLNLKHPENDKIIQENIDGNLKNVTENANLCQMNQQIKNLELNFAHSELSNDIFASLQVPTGCQNPDSTSPTAAFLLAFPLVSSMNVKTAETLDEENVDSQNETPTILQIGTIDANKPTHDTLTSNLLNLDNLSFLSSKDIYSGLYTTFEQHLNCLTTNNFIPDLPKFVGSKLDKTEKIEGKIDGNSYNIDNITGIFEEKPVKNKIPDTKKTNYYNKNILDCAPVKNMDHVPTCQNLFHFDGKNGKNVDENNLFITEKQKEQSTNTQYLQKNMVQNNCQLAFTENKNFVPITSQANFNLFNIDQNFPNFLQKNANYKTPNFENQKDQNDTSKTCNFNEKNVQKNTDFTFTFTLDQTKKVEEPKQTLPSYSMTYTNYDLNNFTKVCSSTTNKTFPDPLYTNSNNNSYNYYTTSDYLSDNCFKNIKNDKNLPSMDFENCIFPENFQKTKPENAAKPTYNWMTTPKTSIDHILPPFSKDEVFSNLNNQFFNSVIFPETPKNLLNQKNDDDNQFTWSPTKIPQFLDPVPNFVSSTLPTLVGDLALNFNEQKTDKQIKTSKKLNCENQNTLFTVNQLVHKEPSKTIRRRNSGSCSKTVQKTKKIMKLDEVKNFVQTKNDKRFCDGTNKRNSKNYTAEALMSSETKKNLLPSFIPDLFFPSVDTDFQQNFPPFPSFSTNNFIPSINPTDEFQIENINLNVKDKKLKIKETKASPPKKLKRKTNNEQNFVDYSFLTVPANGNSPDEFHANFLPPPPPPPPTQPQLFPCKNPSYVLCCNITSTAPLLPPPPPIPTVSRARIQHPEISPSLNTAGTSLANFNLSTIFPEINKSSLEMYPKEQVSHSVPTNSKHNFSYSSCQNSQNFDGNR